MNSDEEFQQKKLEYYKAILGAWFATRLERDKSILTLSSAAIGLLVTLLTKFGVQGSCELLLFILGILSFLVSASAIIWIFHHNAVHLERVAREEEQSSQLLGALDRVATVAFLVGLLLFFCIGILTAVDSYSNRINSNGGASMQEKVNPKASGVLNESLNGVVNLKPNNVQRAEYRTDSFDGVANLRPTNQVSGSTPAGQQAAPSSTPQSPQATPSDKAGQ